MAMAEVGQGFGSRINLHIPSTHHHEHDHCRRLLHRRHLRMSSSSSSSSSSAIRMPSSSLSSSATRFHGQRMLTSRRNCHLPLFAAQMRSGLIGKAAQKWWEKGADLPNMKEVNGAEELVESLLKAGDKLVVVDFFSPGCGGCRALHPKLCQLAEMNPDVEFLQVNYEEHKSMCYSLNVHVLPFFRFYRGAHGRLCSFSCTNGTINKFKDALAKHSPDRCSLGPPKGLEEKELLALSANKEIPFNYRPKPVHPVHVFSQEKDTADEAATALLSSSKPHVTLPSTSRITDVQALEKDLVKTR